MRYTTLLLICVLALAGCPKGPSPEPSQPVEPPPEATTQPQRVPLMATVNGQHIYMDELYAPLVEAHGLKLARMLILDALVNQEARRRGVAIEAADVEAEIDRALAGIFGDQVTGDQRDRVLDQLLERKGVTRAQWLMAMRRNALLRKIIEPTLTVSETLVRAEFARMYGEKVRVSHIQLPSFSEAEKILALLAKGESFADLARRYSTNTLTARDDGKMPVFTRHDVKVPQAIRKVAFALKTGETSEVVQVGSNFHILQLLERVISANVDYENVKESLTAHVRERLLAKAREDFLLDLRQRAVVEFVDPILRRQNARAGR